MATVIREDSQPPGSERSLTVDFKPVCTALLLVVLRILPRGGNVLSDMHVLDARRFRFRR